MDLNKSETKYAFTIDHNEAQHLLNALHHYVTNIDCLKHHGDLKTWTESEQYYLSLIYELNTLLSTSVFQQTIETVTRFYEKSIKHEDNEQT